MPQYNSVPKKRKQFAHEWSSWRSLRRRCKYPYEPSYRYVGAKGLSYDPRWDSFDAFLADIGPAPSQRHSIDRIDNARGYYPDNVRWATPRQQQINTCKAKFVDFNGERLCYSECAERLKLPYSTFTWRLKNGWPLDHIASTPSIEKFNGRRKSYALL